jgi:hypothetical protein
MSVFDNSTFKGPDASYYIPPDEDELDESDEFTTRMARRRQLRRLIDIDNEIEKVLDKLRESVALRVLVEEAFDDPPADPTRSLPHVSDRIRMGDDVWIAASTVADEAFSLLEVVVPED